MRSRSSRTCAVVAYPLPSGSALCEQRGVVDGRGAGSAPTTTGNHDIWPLSEHDILETVSLHCCPTRSRWRLQQGDRIAAGHAIRPLSVAATMCCTRSSGASVASIAMGSMLRSSPAAVRLAAPIIAGVACARNAAIHAGDGHAYATASTCPRRRRHPSPVPSPRRCCPCRSCDRSLPYSSRPRQQRPPPHPFPRNRSSLDQARSGCTRRRRSSASAGVLSRAGLLADHLLSFGVLSVAPTTGHAVRIGPSQEIGMAAAQAYRRCEQGDDPRRRFVGPSFLVVDGRTVASNESVGPQRGPRRAVTLARRRSMMRSRTSSIAARAAATLLPLRAGRLGTRRNRPASNRPRSQYPGGIASPPRIGAPRMWGWVFSKNPLSIRARRSPGRRCSGRAPDRRRGR